MTVDEETVRRIAKLSGLAVSEDRLKSFAEELGGILKWAGSGETPFPIVPSIRIPAWAVKKMSRGSIFEARGNFLKG